MTEVRLFERPTPIQGGPDGLLNWLDMFAGSYFEDVPVSARPPIYADVARRLAPTRLQDGVWIADYVRLRFIAVRD